MCACTQQLIERTDRKCSDWRGGIWLQAGCSRNIFTSTFLYPTWNHMSNVHFKCSRASTSFRYLDVVQFNFLVRVQYEIIEKSNVAYQIHELQNFCRSAEQSDEVNIFCLGKGCDGLDRRTGSMFSVFLMLFTEA